MKKLIIILLVMNLHVTTKAFEKKCLHKYFSSLELGFTSKEKQRELELITKLPIITLEDFKVLIEKGININFKDQDGRSLLMLALIYDRNDIAKFLILEKKVKINQKSNQENTALVFAKDKEIKELLLKHGAQY